MRIKCWTNNADGTDVSWLLISKNNITTRYDRTADSSIADPDPPNSGRIFSWLICQSHDDKGNAINSFGGEIQKKIQATPTRSHHA